MMSLVVAMLSGVGMIELDFAFQPRRREGEREHAGVALERAADGGERGDLLPFSSQPFTWP